MNNKICQSCGMPINNHELLGTNKDGSINNDYCKYCYIDSSNSTIDETVEKILNNKI